MRLLIALVFVLVATLPAAAQDAVLLFNFEKAHFAWTWEQGDRGPAESFRITCAGGAIVHEVKDPTARSIPVPSVVGIGRYDDCVIQAVNKFDAAPPVGTPGFEVGLPPTPVKDARIEAR